MFQSKTSSTLLQWPFSNLSSSKCRAHHEDCLHGLIRSLSLSHTHTHTHTCTHTLFISLSLLHTHTHKHILSLSHTLSHTISISLSHTHTHTHAHTCTQLGITCVQARSEIYQPILWLPPSFLRPARLWRYFLISLHNHLHFHDDHTNLQRRWFELKIFFALIRFHHHHHYQWYATNRIGILYSATQKIWAALLLLLMMMMLLLLLSIMLMLVLLLL